MLVVAHFDFHEQPWVFPCENLRFEIHIQTSHVDFLQETKKKVVVPVEETTPVVEATAQEVGSEEGSLEDSEEEEEDEEDEESSSEESSSEEVCGKWFSIEQFQLICEWCWHRFSCSARVDLQESSSYEMDSEEEAEEKLRLAKENREARLKKAMEAGSKDHLRSPIGCILGHVDTGKSSKQLCILLMRDYVSNNHY